METRGDAGRGFTLIETAAAVLAAGLIGSMGLVALGQQPGTPRDRARQVKDSTQLRGIHQAFVVWAANHDDLYPLPSKIDKKDATVKEQGKAKDTTANILSMLVYNGSIAPEMLVSPVEKHPAVKAHKGYEFDRPQAAADPKKAQWDPSLRAGLGARGGNVSYAHLQPSGKRLDMWTNSFNLREFVLSNRGPEISEVALAPDHTVPAKHAPAVTPTFAKADSRTLSMMGDGTSWSGHMVSNDNHVQFESQMLASGKPFSHELLAFSDGEKKLRSDIIFFDERDDPASRNHYLGIFTRAGATPAEFQAEWD